MDQFDLEYLKELLADAEQKRYDIPFRLPDEDGADITYLPSKLRIYWPGRIGSLDFQLEMESCGVQEQSKLRSNAKNYFRILRKDGKLLRIDSYIQGRLDVINLFHYEGSKRYSIPFTSWGTPYPTCICVLIENDGSVPEAYMVGNGQIIYCAYRNIAPQTVERRRINYVPNGQLPVRSKDIFHFHLDSELHSTEIAAWSCFDDKQNGTQEEFQ
jgi:hypothetical protein